MLFKFITPSYNFDVNNSLKISLIEVNIIKVSIFKIRNNNIHINTKESTNI